VKKTSFTKSILLACVTTFSLQAGANTTSTLPDAGCSLADLAGSYTWYETTRTPLSYYGSPDEGYVHAVSVGREVNDGQGNITAGSMNIHNTFGGTSGAATPITNYTGTITLEPNCIGTYLITLEGGEVGSGGGGRIYVDPVSGNFTMLDEYNIGIATFRKDGSDGGLKNPFPTIRWP
jgi:hypothetical protein